MNSIGIDCRFAATHSGLGRYTRELVTNLLARRDAFHYVLFVRSDQEPWVPRDFGSAYTLCPAPFLHYSFAEQTRFPALIRSSGVDLLFSPHFNVPAACPVPTVVTIHDMILHRYPNDANVLRQLAFRFLFRRAVRRAQQVIAVSAFVGSELSSVYGYALQDKLRVIPEAISDQFQQQPLSARADVLQKHRLDKPFFLYVGNAKEHKNVQMLIEAFAVFADPSKELVLVTGGKESHSLKLRPGVRLLPGVPEADMPALYSAALCLVSASLYEGFGLPLLEANACGCPAIVTKRGAFPEIAPPGTVLLEPDTQAFADAMRAPPVWQPNLTTRTWADAAAETADVFREALRGV